MNKKYFSLIRLTQLILSFLIVAFFLIGCSINDPAGPSQNKITGTWQLETVTYYDSNDNIKYQKSLDTCDFQPLISYHDVYRQCLYGSTGENISGETHTEIIEEFYTYEKNTISLTPIKIILHNMKEYLWDPETGMFGETHKAAPYEEDIVFDDDNFYKRLMPATEKQAAEGIMYMEIKYKRISQLPAELRKMLY